MKKISFKLWAGMMVLVLIVLLLLWLFQIVFLENFYTNMRVSGIKNEAVTIIKVLDSGNRSEFQDQLDKFAFSNNISIEMLDFDGRSVYITGQSGSSGQMPMMMNSARAEVYEKVFGGTEVIVPLVHPRFGNKFMLIGLPVSTSGRISGVMLLNMPMAPVEDTVSILKKQLLYITLILIAASLGISFLISRSFTRPILEIKKATEIMATGDFSVRIKSKQQDEIGKVAETINYLGQQLSQIEQLRKDLIANVSHELRTPLSLIRGYAETLRDVTGNDTGKREKQLGIVIDETERLSKIVDDILNLSQLQSGNFKLNIVGFEINKLLSDVIQRYNVLSEKSGVRIVSNYSSDTIIEADEARLEQVLFNLINNAFNHTQEGGTITVSVVANPETVRIEVSDTGSGIPEEDIAHIWDRYYKADNAEGRRTIGTGLGLAIVKSVLEAHQAAYGVHSKIGMGTTFWFEINYDHRGIVHQIQ